MTNSNKTSEKNSCPRLPNNVRLTIAYMGAFNFEIFRLKIINIFLVTLHSIMLHDLE
jgi:hypothetical protein